MRRETLLSSAVSIALTVSGFGLESSLAHAQDGYLASQASGPASEMLKNLVADGADACSAEELRQVYHRSGFESAAAVLGIVQGLMETGEFDDSAEAREERRRAFEQYTALPCSRGVFRDPNNAVIIEQQEDDLAKGIRNTTGTNPEQAVAEGRTLVSRPLPGCSVVVEWALIELDTTLPFDEDDNWELTEAAFRSLLELQSRGYLPRSMTIESDLFFSLSTVFLEAGDRAFSLAFALAARERLEDFDKKYRNTNVVRPTISMASIERRIGQLTPILPHPCAERINAGSADPQR